MSNRKFFIILALLTCLSPIIMFSLHSIQATFSSYIYTGYYSEYNDNNIIESSKYDVLK